MRPRNFRTWQDRASWALIALGVVILLIPTATKLRVADPLRLVLLAPLRGVAELRTTLADLATENRQLSRLAATLNVENARLRTLLQRDRDKPPRGLDVVRAPVIGRDLATLERFLVVSRGTRFGVEPGAPAIAADGVVGRVVSVDAHQALVQTILDPDSRVSVINRRSRIPALARSGDRKQLRLDLVQDDADFRQGDTIVTAGLGGIFPPGLRVGIVTASNSVPGEMFRDVAVRPLVSITRLETVFLLAIGPADSERDDWLDNIRLPAGPSDTPDAGP